MADQFDITPEQGRRQVIAAQELSKITYHNVMAAWRHEIGAYLTIERLGELPLYVIAWRSNPFMMCKTIDYVDRVDEDDFVLAWATLCMKARSHFASGPTDEVRAKAEKEMSNKSKANSQRAIDQHTQERLKRDQGRVEAGVSSEPGAPIALTGEPVALLENELWEVTDTADKITYASREHKRVALIAELSNGFWSVQRCFPLASGEGDSDKVRTISPNKDGKFERYEAIAAMNHIAATDSTKWRHGDYNVRPS